MEGYQNGYDFMDGTSMAAPMVAGVVDEGFVPDRQQGLAVGVRHGKTTSKYWSVQPVVPRLHLLRFRRDHPAADDYEEMVDTIKEFRTYPISIFIIQITSNPNLDNDDIDIRNLMDDLEWNNIHLTTRQYVKVIQVPNTSHLEREIIWTLLSHIFQYQNR